MQISFAVDQRQLDTLMRAFKEVPGKAAQAAVYALNRAADTGKAAAIRQLVANLGIKKRDLTTPHRWGERGKPRPAVRVTKATKATLSARLTIESGRIPVIFFGAKATPLTEKARVYTGRGWKTLKHGTGVRWSMGKFGSRFVESAFIGRGRSGRASSADDAASGHTGVFIRKPGVQRLPIKQLLGVSAGEAALKDTALRRVLEVEIPKAIEKRMDYELGRILEGR